MKRTTATVFCLLGVALIATGVAFIYWPAALITAGIGLLVVGLLVIELD